jgi:hypothetical protein
MAASYFLKNFGVITKGFLLPRLIKATEMFEKRTSEVRYLKPNNASHS